MCDNKDFDPLSLDLIKFFPNLNNLKNLYTRFKNNELKTLKIIFDNCQYLESVKINCADLNEKDIFVKCLPKKFLQIKNELFMLSWRISITSRILYYFIISV